MTGYIAATIPAKVDRVSGTTLFHVAMLETGDPMQWVALAQLNGLVDPWIDEQYDILIPPVLPSGTQTGILDFSDVSLAKPSTVVSSVQVLQVSGTVSSGTPSLDFSSVPNSQFLPLLG
jgi:hypothetical protein